MYIKVGFYIIVVIFEGEGVMIFFIVGKWGLCDYYDYWILFCSVCSNFMEIS